MEARRAKEEDKKELLEIIKELDLSYPGQDILSFWVLLDKKNIVSIASLEDFKDFAFISSVGTIPSMQNKGFSKILLSKIMETIKKDIYLYTIIPDFFKKLGFAVIEKDRELPSKKTFLCKECEPDKCACMVKRYDS